MAELRLDFHPARLVGDEGGEVFEVRGTAGAGVSQHFVTLHVGAGTFLPMKVDDTDDHLMHAEYGVVPAETAAALNAVRAAGGRIVCVGTTSLRLLESAATDEGVINPWAGETAIFITPGYRFRAVDVLMTNFHLPKSTLFMLVSAFSGFETMKAAYAHAIPAIPGHTIFMTVANHFELLGTDGAARSRYYAFEKLTGELVWASTPGTDPVDNPMGAPLFADLGTHRVFYVGTGCGHVVCINARTGEPVWRFKLSNGGLNSDMLLDGPGRLIAIHGKENVDASSQGRLVALKIPTEYPTGPKPVILGKDAELWRNDSFS
eukprot:gene7271-9804_t